MYIDTVRKAEKVIEWLDTCAHQVIDTETTGLLPFHGDRVCGIAVKGVDEYADDPDTDTCAYFPFRHEVGFNLPLEILWQFRELFTKKDVMYTGFNYKFDLLMMLQDGIELPEQIQDVIIAAHLMNENEKTPPKSVYNDLVERGIIVPDDKDTHPGHKLKYLADRYLGPGASQESHDLIDLIITKGYASKNSRNKAKGMICRLDGAEVSAYGCDDVELTYKLLNFYTPNLHAWRIYDTWVQHNEYLLILTQMEQRGVMMDREAIHRFSQEATDMVAPVKEKLQAMAYERTGGQNFNPNSNPQKYAILGTTSADADTVEMLTEHPDEFIAEFAKTLQNYGGWAKANNTFYEPYLDWMDENDVIHPSYNITGTVTGRLSCSNPNLQQVPRKATEYKVKECFIARPGYTLISADYSQAEIRVTAHSSQDENLIDIILSGQDFHSRTAELNNIDRYQAKTINFQVDYGSGPKKLAEALKIPFGAAKAMLTKYWKTFSGKDKLFKKCMQQAEEAGYLRLYNGRCRHYQANSRTYSAMNFLAQGTVGAIMCEKTVSVHKKLCSTYDMFLLLQVHDQFIIEVRTEQLAEVLPLLKAEMEDIKFEKGAIPTVPMKVDISYGHSWGNLTDWKAE